MKLEQPPRAPRRSAQPRATLWLAAALAVVVEAAPVPLAAQQLPRYTGEASRRGRLNWSDDGRTWLNANAAEMFPHETHQRAAFFIASNDVFLATTWYSQNGPPDQHEAKEQTFLVLEGSGEVTVDGETRPVTGGDVVCVPWKAPHTTEAGPDGPLIYLCLNSIVTEEREATFQAMYDRVAAGRIARWKSGDTTVGE